MAKNCWKSTRPENEVKDWVSNARADGVDLSPHFRPATLHGVDLLAMRCFQATRIVAREVHFSRRPFCCDAHCGHPCEPSANRTPGEFRKPRLPTQELPRFFATSGRSRATSSSVYATGGLILNWFRAKGTVSSGSVEGLNNKAKTDYEKSLWVSYLRRHRNRPISHTWRASRAKLHPRNSV